MGDEIVYFLKEHWMDILTFLLSLIGAAAWIPTIINHFKVERRKICGKIIDYRIINKAKVSHDSLQNKLDGTILILAVNMYIKYEPFFAEKLISKISIKNQKYSGVLLDGTIIKKESEQANEKKFIFPEEYNFNMHREIKHTEDNLRIISLFIENADFDNIDVIKYLKLTFADNKASKKIKFKTKDFPKLDRVRFIEKYIHALGTIQVLHI